MKRKKDPRAGHWRKRGEGYIWVAPGWVKKGA